MNQHFIEIELKLAQRFRDVDQRLNELELKIEQRFTAIDQRFSDMELETEQRFSAVDRRFNQLELEIAEVKGTQRLLQWMLGFNLALTVAVLFLLLRAGV